ncbi:MAG: diacylglycerol/polyprenol kinase family protein [cyanobacterium endosymbiont of Rhopalodia musculus]|uniref:diacylglycerol/polyprenol kinase family protein n=1 Tax=cyanobacterium endosymbiont of Epithemia clementina EcSB TaxID=3034674 RepID=UPI002480B2C7|nr:diacylglycerol/polyprenol kinase family protein [cyanobacterium endosymbiont of Epithemia clementina EcSB]WGT66921.1 SEC59/DGK1/VTE5 family protein [cyanobacterium endosymbiont of Epithemia clementina EcSB]
MSKLLPKLELLSSVWYPLSLVLIYLGTIIGLAERMNRLTGADAEFTRKVVHIGSGNVILIAWWFKLPPWLLLVASLIASFIALISYFLPILPSINSVERKSLGTFFYAVSIGILTYWFWIVNKPQYTAIGILIMAWGDGMAAIIGKRFGRHPYQILGIKKSWEGSLTMMGVSFFVTSIILFFTGESINLILITSLLVSVIATGLEAFSKWGLDNLTVPLSSAIVAFYLT